jgi:hypothetical protein
MLKIHTRLLGCYAVWTVRERTTDVSKDGTAFILCVKQSVIDEPLSFTLHGTVFFYQDVFINFILLSIQTTLIFYTLITY